MVKKRPTDTIPAAEPPSQEELDTRMTQFREGLKASCQESLARSRKDGFWLLQFLNKENCIGALLFALVWLAGGFFRFLLVQGNTISERLCNREFLLFLLILALFQAFFICALNAPWKYSRNIPKLREFLLVSILMIVEFAAVYLIVKTERIPTDRPWQVATVMPLALVPALLINILDARTAVCTAVLEAILLPMQVTGTAGGDHYRLFCFALMISMVAIPCFRDIRLRIHYISHGVLQGVFISLAGLIFYLTEETVPTGTEWQDILRQTTVPGLSQGILTGIVCMLFLPIFESIFHLQTPMTLSELTDVNSPLLQRLRNEAPGTYQHSLDVAEMATNAASQIGADAKLVHVMGLYHDVGKLFAPQYFAENMNGRQNPLETSLRPEESADLIFEHANHGVQLANKYHLSSLIIPAIRQHHGNTLLEHFYRKACDQAKAEGLQPPSPEDFRYPQNPSASKEVAILSLADSCEAGVRALLSAKPDLKNISQKIVDETKDAGANAATKCASILEESLEKQDTNAIIQAIDARIASIILKRFEDHQLDKVPITTQELATIAKSFRETILSHFHTRPEYRLK